MNALKDYRVWLADGSHFAFFPEALNTGSRPRLWDSSAEPNRVVPRTGLEPAPHCWDQALNLACLPISPPGQAEATSL
jgi:hypothetical protein